MLKKRAREQDEKIRMNSEPVKSEPADLDNDRPMKNAVRAWPQRVQSEAPSEIPDTVEADAMDVDNLASIEDADRRAGIDTSYVFKHKGTKSQPIKLE